MFNDSKENIMYMESRRSQLFVITYEQTLANNCSGKIKNFTFRGYLLDKYPGGFKIGSSFIKMQCEAVYDEKCGYLRNVFIRNFISDESQRDQGYGSIVMEQFLQYARRLKVVYISGILSFVDIGTGSDEDEEVKRNNRERLYHFYPKFGFVIDKVKETIRLDLTN